MGKGAFMQAYLREASTAMNPLPKIATNGQRGVKIAMLAEGDRNLRIVISALGLTAALLLAGCAKNPLLVTRSPCPAVAVPLHSGSITRFEPSHSRDADAIAFAAQITDLRGDCVEGIDTLTTDVNFTVAAQRRHAGAAQDVRLPIFVALVQGGNVLVSKELMGVDVHFPEGALRAETRSVVRAEVQRAAATLEPELQERISRKRQPNELDALSDPMADPQVRAAVRAATFEVLVGFQLDDASLAYNVGK